jgi:repressor LexA
MEQQTIATTTQPVILRPTKKQREILTFIETFIAEHGYSPSYREIMTGLNYTSVATVALHVSSLIKRGHLRKRDHSARSLEVVQAEAKNKLQTNEIKPAEEKWLVEKIDYYCMHVEEAPSESNLDQLYVLVGALKVLGLEGAANAYLPRLASLKKLLESRHA